tara:strand:+ start:928 stop:1371 length:444 start_codon:yes stop_codon:yes gene_type:complete
MKYNIILSIGLLLILSSCGSKIDSAKESLEGTWQVKEIFKNYPSTGDFMEDKSGVGTFIFTSSQCDYNYTFDSVEEMNTFEYEFQITKENSGFTRVDIFEILGEERYRIRFGDQTSDAHEEATEMSLERTVDNDSIAYDLLILLEKK